LRCVPRRLGWAHACLGARRRVWRARVDRPTSEEFDGAVDVTLIDQSDAFVFVFSKLDVMFGRAVPEEVRHPYSDLVKPGVQFVQAKVQAIDPVAKCVRTDAGAAIFAVFLFLTHCLQQDRGYTPIRTGVASATVSASQQIGGSLGTALLSTIAASALTSYITSAHAHPTRVLLAHAALHGDTTAFAWAAAFFAAGAVISAALFERGTKALRIDRPARQRPPTDHRPALGDVRGATRRQPRRAPIRRHGRAAEPMAARPPGRGRTGLASSRAAWARPRDLT